jgi:ABC-type nitrate/sulfonate/bicarbonate transport system substrate-binding protein
MTARRAPAILAVALSIAALIVHVVARAQTAPLNPRVALKMGAVGALSDAGIFVALDKGFFSDEGLDIELVTFKQGPQIIPSLATDQTQVSGTAVSASLFNALARGVDMKLVADKGQVSKGFGWAAIAMRSDLADAIKDYKDLKGRKIALPAKSVSLFTQLEKALEMGGLTVNDIDLTEIGFVEMMAAFANKAIDVAVLIEPFTTLVVERKVAVRWKGVEDYYPFKAQNGVIMYAEKFMRQQPDAARRWMVGYLRGVRAYRHALATGQDLDAIYAIIARHTDVKDKTLYPKMQPTDLALDGRVETRSLEWDQDWFMKLGLQRERADLSKMIDYQYIDYAAARLDKR